MSFPQGFEARETYLSKSESTMLPLYLSMWYGTDELTSKPVERKPKKINAILNNEQEVPTEEQSENSLDLFTHDERKHELNDSSKGKRHIKEDVIADKENETICRCRPINCK